MQIVMDRLRKDLEDKFGAAMFSGLPMAVIDLSDVQRATPEELVEIAQKNGIDLRRYAVQIE